MRDINQIMILAQEISPLFLSYKTRKHEMKNILGGIIWILVTGSQWHLLPRENFPPKSTCYYWFEKFRKNNILGIILFNMSSKNKKNKDYQIKEAYIDATFTESKRGGDKIGGTKAGKGTKLFAIVSRNNKILHLSLENATPHESKFILPIIEKMPKKLKPLILIGDKAYDSFPIKNQLQELEVKLIAPNKINRINNRQDGRNLRRYKRRHIVENYFADLQTFRRVIIRYERKSENYLAFVKLAAICLNFWKFNIGMKIVA